MLCRECRAAGCRFQLRRNSERCNFSVAVHGKKRLLPSSGKKRDMTVTSQRTSAGAEVKSPKGETCRINVNWESFPFFRESEATIWEVIEKQ